MSGTRLDLPALLLTSLPAFVFVLIFEQAVPLSSVSLVQSGLDFGVATICQGFYYSHASMVYEAFVLQLVLCIMIMIS